MCVRVYVCACVFACVHTKVLRSEFANRAKIPTATRLMLVANTISIQLMQEMKSNPIGFSEGEAQQETLEMGSRLATDTHPSLLSTLPIHPLAISEHLGSLEASWEGFAGLTVAFIASSSDMCQHSHGPAIQTRKQILARACQRRECSRTPADKHKCEH